MPFRIVIDTRHIRDFGIGTYIRNLVRALAQLDSDNHYILVSYPADAAGTEPGCLRTSRSPLYETAGLRAGWTRLPSRSSCGASGPMSATSR